MLVCRSKTTFILNLPRTLLDSYKDNFNNSTDDDGNIRHYHIVIHKYKNGQATLLLSKPQLKKIDISQYIVADI